MMFKVNVVILVFLSIFSFSKTFSQENIPTQTKTEAKVEFDLFTNLPSLGVSLPDTAKLKIFLRKNNYASQKMVILDVAMLTTSEGEYYFPSLFTIEFKIKDKLGNTIGVYPFTATSRRFSPHLLKGGLESQTFYLIVNCQKEKYPIPDNLEDAADNKVIFDNNLFRTDADACIDFKKTGLYEISVELSNNLVLNSGNQKAIKTAVGKVTSNIIKMYVDR